MRVGNALIFSANPGVPGASATLMAGLDLGVADQETLGSLVLDERIVGEPSDGATPSAHIAEGVPRCPAHATPRIRVPVRLANRRRHRGPPRRGAAHLSAAMQFLGYRHVIATMWTSGGVPNPGHNATALHGAVRVIKNMDPMERGIWAPYIHLGS